MFRLLVTGSRDWDDVERIRTALTHIQTKVKTFTLVSGACPTGADKICEDVAEELGMRVERHPADWDTQGKKAGFLRNAEMIRTQPDACFAFIKNDSRGATHTYNLALKAGIPTVVLREYS